ncbi:MAG: AAA family ATPase [Planktothrix sp.]
MKQRVISLRTLQEKTFKLLLFEGFWLECMGTPEANFSALFWGKSGSGKSTLMLRLCDYLAKWGKVCYNSWEEGIAKTFQDRVTQLNIQRLDKIFLLEKYRFEEMMSDDFKRKNYKVIVIDSVNYMSLTYEQYKALRDKYPHKILLFIQQMGNRGNPKGGTDIYHATDIKVTCMGGKAKFEGRYAPERTVQIFEKKTQKGEQIPLSLTPSPSPKERGVEGVSERVRVAIDKAKEALVSENQF